jgi:membrane protease YdiL (CAAX protease family)
MIAGLAFAYSVKWTGSLWWALGCHMTWDWGESFFYGVADSGVKASHRLFSGEPMGPAWLSGGSVGPEGSVLAAIVLLLLIVVVRLSTQRVDNPELHRLTRPAPVDNPQDPGGVPVA